MKVKITPAQLAAIQKRQSSGIQAQHALDVAKARAEVEESCFIEVLMMIAVDAGAPDGQAVAGFEFGQDKDGCYLVIKQQPTSGAEPL